MIPLPFSLLPSGVEQHYMGAGAYLQSHPFSRRVTSLPFPSSTPLVIQLNATASAVKASFPSCFIFYNEGGAPLYEGRNINHYSAP